MSTRSLKKRTIIDGAVVEKEFMDKYGVNPGDAMLAEEKHKPLYEELVKKYNCEYIAGGAAQNSIRVAQWMLQVPGATTYIGSVGNNDHVAKQMQKSVDSAGVKAHYMIDEQTPTGVCAVLVHKGERALVTRLDAANNYKDDHLAKPDTWKFVQQARFVYIEGYFLTVSPAAIMRLAKHCTAENKTFMMNVSAPFLVQVPDFLNAFKEAMPYVDVLFGNETEAMEFAKAFELNASTVQEAALKASKLQKQSGAQCRTVVFTQGKDATVIAHNGKVYEFPVIPLPDEKVVDTNGAGDAFVGGFLSQFITGKSLHECCRAGNHAAHTIIQHSGCKFPDTPSFIWA
jgi:adenosine kinase